MKQIATLIATFLAGTGLAFEAGLLGPLGETVGHYSAALSIFLVGTLILTLALIFVPGVDLGRVFRQPRWQLTGGVMGPIYVVALTLATPVIGVGTTMVAVLAGQIGGSLLIDHFGWLGSAGRRIDFYRMGALGLIAAALVLMNLKADIL
ncbi:DMT family transporter [Paracoccus sp. R86501]|uniref:DMT family transporter n=1 Tax=Paracoccus sp. R86501 TaxID=3101711 RepID=UPI00366F2483